MRLFVMAQIGVEGEPIVIEAGERNAHRAFRRIMGYLARLRAEGESRRMAVGIGTADDLIAKVEWEEIGGGDDPDCV
jgi:hypothetical protein